MSWKKIVVRLSLLSVILGLLFLVAWLGIMNPTSANYNQEAKVPVDPAQLRAHVAALTSTTKPRNHRNVESLEEAANYVKAQWEKLGLAVTEQPYQVEGKTYRNLIVSFGPKDAPRVVVGAHYDVCEDQPGADDNASGVAGLMELARLLSASPLQLPHRVDLVAYTLEEPPYFGSEHMGSFVHAASLKKEKTKVKAMLSLEMIGFFTDDPGSQKFPIGALEHFYPDTGNFIAIVGDMYSWRFVRRIKQLMQETSQVEVFSINAPTVIPGIDFSDHSSYWRHGYPAVMITDTAFYRNMNYHSPGDSIETLDFKRMAEVVKGVHNVILGF